MYGDTLVEAWRGTFLGEPSVRAQGCADVFHNQFGVRYRAAALGIAGNCPVPLSCLYRALPAETQRFPMMHLHGPKTCSSLFKIGLC